MTCLDENTVAAFADGRLGAAEAEEVDAHLDSCAQCRKLVAKVAVGRSGPSVAAQPRKVLRRGDTLGRYVILDPVGAGAIGVVYAAFDPSLDRKVALKLLRGDSRGSEPAEASRERLLREAKAMAKLSHPNVVAVFDVGVVDDQVFVAMEFVQGQTLRAWLAAPSRSPEAVLDVFARAGQGLAAAHAAGLVHRDFKPENVLVADDGRVCVTDFGLARDAMPSEGRRESRRLVATGDGLSAPIPLPSITHAGTLVGTPAYMAPEQLRGAGVDARSDQFSFCVALYEALFGARPFQGKDVETLAAEIARGVPAATSAPKVSARVRAAVVRGLSAEQDRRFASMNALLAELSPRKASGPIRALAIILALGAVATAVAAPVAATRARVLACKSSAPAVWDDARKAAVRAAFTATGEPFAPSAWAEVERAIDAHARELAALSESACTAHARAQTSEQLYALQTGCLQTRAKETRALIDVFASADKAMVGRAVGAASALTPVRACADAAALSAPLPPPDGAGARIDAIRDQLARCKAQLDSGRYPKALELAKAAAADAEQLGWQPLVADAQELLAEAQRGVGAFAEAETAFLASARAAEAGRYDAQVARALSSLVWIEGNSLGRPPEAHRFARLAQGAIDRIGGDDDIESMLLGHEGVVFLEEGKFDEALAAQERCFSIRSRLLGPEALDTAKAEVNVGAAYVALHRYDEAVVRYEHALATFERRLGPDHPNIAVVLSNLVEVYVEKGDDAKALTVALRALSIRERALGPKHPGTATTLLNVAGVYMHQKRFDEARPLLERAVGIYEEAVGKDHIYLADPLTDLGEVYAEQGELDRSIAAYERAVALRKDGGDGPFKGASSNFGLAKVLARKGRDLPRAKALAHAARDAYAKGGKPFEKDLAEVDAWLAQHDH